MSRDPDLLGQAIAPVVPNALTFSPAGIDYRPVSRRIFREFFRKTQEEYDGSSLVL
ncbi:hypothetical protein ACN4EK_11110 [Pantanalinema rosaneae CENA516]|uniref:hypothetical protein n=1 Tax=Pantanalinema rosaneae TaxID=1620701 RepID=UPI003D6FC7D2